MKKSSLALGTLIFLSTPLLAQERVTAKWNDPSRPGLLKVNWIMGSISVKTHNTDDVTVETKGDRNRLDERIVRRPAPPETAGLRRIDSGGAPLTIDSDSNNVMTITGGGIVPGISDLEIEVPAKTNLNLQTVNGRTISVDGVEGDIEVMAVNGNVSLTNIVGSVVAHSMNGKVVVSFQNVAAGKPMSFTSMNGNVDVTLPAASKANLKMRTRNGGIYTDFDLQMTPPSGPANSTQGQTGLRRIQLEKNVAGTINGGGAEFDLRSQNGNIYLRRAK
jgi:hypothetical protein